ncbi:short chain dehydrogenase/reductase [Apiospora hydei]|uniref:Short chain dehydrogenase/reductase n=1 Tax=Apiospora hydei TaxID=1337664 RepID=A0ABR1XBI3_9PEZI
MTNIPARQKTVLVTGCTPGGIGHALCIEFQKRGLRVIATARNVDVLSDLTQQGMEALPLDVTSKESIASCHEAVGKLTGGQLDILVNNAGRTHTHPALDLDMDDVRQTFETNVFGVMAMVAAFGDQLIAAKGLRLLRQQGAVVSYSRTLRQELAPFGVRVMVCMAGTVKSNIASRGHRSLPERSVYQPIRDVFERRLVFSQTQDSMSTEEFASAMVDKALAPEVWWFLRAWVGRPDWFWRGGMASLQWWAMLLTGEWLVDYSSWRMFGLDKLQRIVQQDAAAQSSNAEDSKAKAQ